MYYLPIILISLPGLLTWWGHPSRNPALGQFMKAGRLHRRDVPGNGEGFALVKCGKELGTTEEMVISWDFIVISWDFIVISCDFLVIQWWFLCFQHGIYPLVNIQKTIESGHRNSGISHWTWWFSIAMLVHQRVPFWLTIIGSYILKIFFRWSLWESLLTNQQRKDLKTAQNSEV